MSTGDFKTCNCNKNINRSGMVICNQDCKYSIENSKENKKKCMNQEEILEGNRLVAEFMGGEFESRRIITVGGPRKGKWTFPLGVWCYDDQIKYNSSWDWLMPVVETIYLTRTVTLKMSLGRIHIKCDLYGGFNGSSFCIPEKTGLECWYMSVVEFVKWYNQSKVLIENIK